MKGGVKMSANLCAAGQQLFEDVADRRTRSKNSLQHERQVELAQSRGWPTRVRLYMSAKCKDGIRSGRDDNGGAGHPTDMPKTAWRHSRKWPHVEAKNAL